MTKRGIGDIIYVYIITFGVIMVGKDNLLIVGAGGYGQLAKEVAVAMDNFDKIDFLDDTSALAIGKTDEMALFTAEYTCAFVAIGNANSRSLLLKRLQACGYRIVTLVHPKAYVSPSAELGDGCCIEPFATVHTGAVLGEGCFVCAGAVVNHDATLGVCCQVDCNATVSARASVQSGVKISHGQVL